ncbi:MAG: hypothetical protein MUP98_21360 [Candidatus Aminicenantes bacterium]|nr:hypothetical protein [Candidatus Aminicenantes bacterium]
MVQQVKKSIFGVLTYLALLLSVFGGMSFSQEKEIDTEKLYGEIAGSYEFEYEGLSMVFVVSVEEGKLMVAPEGEVPDTMQPVEDKDMTFIAFNPEGMEYQFKFARDDDGKITKCTVSVPAAGIEVEGIRIKG